MLIGWNVAVWLYLALDWWMMIRADHKRLRRISCVHAEGAAVVLAAIVFAAIASLGAIVAELSAAKAQGGAQAASHVALVASTVIASWLLLPTMFALNYASLYYAHRNEAGGGLGFPPPDAEDEADENRKDGTTEWRPDYWDFMYFSVTIAVAAQTADVSITSPRMRRLVLVQALLSFAFNTIILALTINIGASLLA